MTRRKFNADLASAAKVPLPLISGIKKGDDDGQVDFVYTHDALAAPVSIRLLNLGIDEYPEHPGFLAFTPNEHVPGSVTKVLEQCPEFSENKKIADICRILSRKLTASIESETDVLMTDDEWPLDNEADHPITTESDAEEEDDAEAEYIGSVCEDEDVEYDLEDFDFNPKKPGAKHGPLTDRLVSDLRMAQKAGFRVGIFFESQHVYSLSIPARALGLQEETLAAWGVEPLDYIVLLIKIDGAYAPAETFIELISASNSAITFRFGKCANNKPTTASVELAFDSSQKKRPVQGANGGDVGSPFEQLLVSNSMDWWMNKDFASLLKLRLNYGLTWDASILQLINFTVQGNNDSMEDQMFGEHDDAATIVAATALDPLNVDFVHHDVPGFTPPNPLSKSLPLIAAQFALRYFAKSPRYCMVCHCRSEDDFEAMKPYVCTKELCLFQYMSLGFGQSIEHEIISQPLVVDLLISFCYIALADNKLREYPKGLGFNVPIMPHHSILIPNVANWNANSLSTISIPSPVEAFQPVSVSVNLSTATISFDTDTSQGLKAGSLFALKLRPALSPNNILQEAVTMHCKATGTDFVAGRTCVTYEAISTTSATSSVPKTSETAPAPKGDERDNTTTADEIPAELYIYEHSIDELAPTDMRRALLTLLDTLPSVMDMHKELTEGGVGFLANCSGVLAPSLALLRWIVSSNRSLIVQVDFPQTDSDLDTIKDLNRPHESLHGVGNNCVQFKFAQGSPDKEHRFVSAVEANTQGVSSVPTLFAWHGSAIGNWHSIIRSGLDYSTTVNGRAFGNGVYFSRYHHVSSGYSVPRISVPQWPKSMLNISASISLCEIVNRPDMFVSRDPHYVVKDVDWIQCRYLLVKPTNFNMPSKASKATVKQPSGYFLKQDSSSRPYGPNNETVEIPSAALPKSRPARATDNSAASATESKARLDHTFQDDLDRLMEEGTACPLSSQEIEEDFDEAIDVMFDLDREKTDFRPGTLDIDALPKLPSPTWADDNGRKVLGRELSKMQKVQSKTPLHELGWYMDFEKTDNLFHWIVELHSFDESLSFAKDMKSRDIPSIVLEMRFGRQYPLSPPFVRVIRPRFLPWAEGGGGHVTAGGAMCMELLTNTGWSPANSIESVILQVRMAICNPEPRPARLEQVSRGFGDYGIGEAIEAYKRVATRHGWQVPPDLEETARGT